MDSKTRIHEIAEEKASVIAGMNQAVWDYAEFGYQEVKSAAYLTGVLEKEGFQVERGVAGMDTAFVGTYGSGKPVIGILGEYDALPNLSQKAGVAKRCPIEGKHYGHGCGHSALGAGAVGAALIVKQFLEEAGLPGTVKIFGCPAEETGFGKCFMVKEHCFDDLDLCFSWHPMDSNMCFPRSVAYYKVRFDFTGRTSHAGGAPELGRSALDACELMNVGVNYLREHIISDARIHYAYRDVGGIAPNVVQGHSCVHYFVRAPKSWQVQEIYKRVIDVAEGAAKMTGTEMTYELYAGLSDYIPNHVLSEVLHESMEEIGAPDFDEKDFELARKFFFETATEAELEAKKADLKKKFGAENLEKILEHPLHTTIAPLVWTGAVLPGSTDVGDASYVVPTAQLSEATATLGTASHTWQMTAHGNTEIAHKAMLTAGKSLALAGIKMMENPELVKKARDEWMEETGGVYECPIPKEIGPRLNE